MKKYLGIELGSTRIKAVAIDENFRPILSGSTTWQSKLENGIWTYSLDEVWKGLTTALSELKEQEFEIVGISGMMHGYLAFDKDWNLLVPFRTWQNTITEESATKLTELFHFNIPQRWSIAHLYQAILNKEEHIGKIAHITTLAGYVHHVLTGENVVGIGEASGIFPIDSNTLDYNSEMMEKFNALPEIKDCHWKLQDLLPKVKKAGENAGFLTENGAKQIGNTLKVGTKFCPPEGDAGTGMVATNSISPRTGNVSAGTSIFSMVVLEKALNSVHSEIDMVTTPTGKAVAMVHGNNCTTDMNAWVNIFDEVIKLFGNQVDTSTLYRKLYEKSLEGNEDCDGVLSYNYLTGEGVTHLNDGRPIVTRNANSHFTLANFLRSQLYSTMATLKIGMDLLASEHVVIDRLMGHGGLFKTPLVGQKYLASACNAPVTCMETAGEGGPYGMALLSAYSDYSNKSLEDFLNENVFATSKSVTVSPEEKEVEGFQTYLEKFKAGLLMEKTAIETI